MTTAGASASDPALYQCGAAAKNAEKHYTGAYEKGCKTLNPKHEGKYEFEEWKLGTKENKLGKKGKVKKFKTKGKHDANLEVPVAGGIHCANTEASGEFTGPKTAKLAPVVFTGCKYSLYSCQSGAKAGEIVTNPLQGDLGYLDASKHKVGVDLKAEEGYGGVNAEFTCGSEAGEYFRFQVSGSVVGEVVSAANVFTKVAALKFDQAASKQKWTKLEGQMEDVLITEWCSAIGKACEPNKEPVVSGEETFAEGKGEELYLKA